MYLFPMCQKYTGRWSLIVFDRDLFGAIKWYYSIIMMEALVINNARRVNDENIILKIGTYQQTIIRVVRLNANQT